MKTIVSFLLVIILSNLTIAQTTAIPDANFEQALINLGLDSGPIDGVVLTANVDTVTYLNVEFKFLYNLIGIEDFTALSELRCGYNSIANLNLTQNTVLAKFNCYGDQLTSLDLSQNTYLTDVDCSYNELECLNVKNGNNTIILRLVTLGNQNLTCIEVDNVSYSVNNWPYTYIGFQNAFSTNCNNACSSTPTIISENSLSNLSLYPNPTNGNITIELGEVKQSLKATLTNNLGQVVLTKNYASTAYINLELDYPKGLYFLTLETEGETINKKVVIE